MSTSLIIGASRGIGRESVRQLLADESVAGMLRVIAALTKGDSGTYRSHTGRLAPW